jgi:hypothetical protein
MVGQILIKKLKFIAQVILFLLQLVLAGVKLFLLLDKAQTEYKKYKARTLSSVEEDYLNSIKQLEQKGKK